MLFPLNLIKANIGYFHFKNSFLWLKSIIIIHIYSILMKKFLLYFDKNVQMCNPRSPLQ